MVQPPIDVSHRSLQTTKMFILLYIMRFFLQQVCFYRCGVYFVVQFSLKLFVHYTFGCDSSPRFQFDFVFVKQKGYIQTVLLIISRTFPCPFVLSSKCAVSMENTILDMGFFTSKKKLASRIQYRGDMWLRFDGSLVFSFANFVCST